MKRIKLCYLMLVIFVITSINIKGNTDGFKKIKELDGITEYKLLSNGLTVLLKEDHSAPICAVMITYHVGSRNEVIGTTGFTHILEHLMFKGSKEFNKENGNDITLLIENIGGKMNATTWNDRTNYYEIVPSDYLELAIQIESDRMRNLLLRDEDLRSEMVVILNEYQQGENEPGQALDKLIWSNAYLAHPYHHNTIGWKSDIENVSIEKLRGFYDIYYWPNNATVTIIGDVDTEKTLELIKKYYGSINQSSHEIPQAVTTEPVQEGERRVVLKRPGQIGMITVAYKTPGVLHKDVYSLQVLSSILASSNISRLYKEIVETGKGYFVTSSQSVFKDPSLFTIMAAPTPGTNPEEIERIIKSELEKIKTKGVSDVELQRVVKQNVVGSAFSKDGISSIMEELNEAISYGDWTYYLTFTDKVKKITQGDLQRVAQKYFVDDYSTIGVFSPIEGMGGFSEEEASEALHFNTDKKLYYRSPGMKIEENKSTSSDKLNIEREKIAGIDVVTAKTPIKDVVTITGSLVAGDYFSPKNNSMVASFTAKMLSSGTTTRKKTMITEELMEIGASIDFNNGTHNITFNCSCLRQDINKVIELLADQLRNPVFDAAEFQLIKEQSLGMMMDMEFNTRLVASIGFNRIVYPKDNPNYSLTIEQMVADLNKVQIEDLQDFHKKFYGPESMNLVAVGDIDKDELRNAVKKYFDGWKGGISMPKFSEVEKVATTTKYITVPGKQSVQMLVGQTTELNKTDQDYMAMSLASFILGGNFSSRLMQTVRDEEGLTYGIYSQLSDDTYSDGSWMVAADFNENLLQQGMASTLREIKKFVENGITAEELEMKKTTIIGNNKMLLSSTGNIASAILSNIERGLAPDYWNSHLKKIESVTPEQVNNAIKKYLDLNKLVIVLAGSIDEKGNPLESK